MVDKVNNNNKLSAVILGATGAIGRVIIYICNQILGNSLTIMLK